MRVFYATMFGVREVPGLGEVPVPFIAIDLDEPGNPAPEDTSGLLRLAHGRVSMRLMTGSSALIIARHLLN